MKPEQVTKAIYEIIEISENPEETAITLVGAGIARFIALGFKKIDVLNAMTIVINSKFPQ